LTGYFYQDYLASVRKDQFLSLWGVFLPNQSPCGIIGRLLRRKKRSSQWQPGGFFGQILFSVCPKTPNACHCEAFFAEAIPS